MSYICIAELGEFAPKFKHEGLNDAVEEAKRLHRRGLGDVMVAELKAIITSKDVPVIRKEIVVNYDVDVVEFEIALGKDIISTLKELEDEKL